MSVRARVLLPFAAVLLAAGVAHADRSVRTGRAPGWVRSVPVPDAAAPATAAGEYWLLFDHQSRFGATVDRYTHVAARVLSTEGIGQISELTVDFEPSYQHLTLHSVRIRRGGMVRDVLDLRDVTIAHVEDQADARMYDGRVEATFHIPDVRVGDVVEWSFTITGWNPVLRGQVLGSLLLRFGIPIEHLYERLVVPHGRELAFQKVGTDQQLDRRRRGRWDEYVIDTTAVAGDGQPDDQLPGWYEPASLIRFSSFAGWNQVARWAATTYRGATRPDDRVRAVAERIAARYSEPRDRLRAAARFVQDEVRYVGVEVGEGSHRPRPASQVIEHRFGDCKDKSVLLVSLLSVLGIDAEPALVSSFRGRSLDKWVPSPFAFDHVIVRATVSPKEIAWIDPTISQQRGKRFDALPYERALPVDPDVYGLMPMPAPELKEPSVNVVETFDLPEQADGVAKLSVETRYLKSDAENLRRRLASQSRAEISKSYLDFYSATFAAIERNGDIQVVDDQDANEIVVRESYRIPHFWKHGARDYFDRDASSLVQEPKRLQRTGPFRLAYPTFVRHTVELHVPPWIQFGDLNHTVENPYFRYNVFEGQIGSVVTLVYTLHMRSDHVPAEAMAAYSAARDEVFDNNGFRVNLGAPPLPSSASEETVSKPGLSKMNLHATWPRVLLVIGVVGGAILFIVWSNRRSSRPLGGDLPPTALPAPPMVMPLGPPTNARAIAALWLGLSALLILIIPFVDLVTGTLGIIFGVSGLRRAREVGGLGRGNALAGIWLGIFAVLGSAYVIYSVVVHGKIPMPH